MFTSDGMSFPKFIFCSKTLSYNPAPATQKTDMISWIVTVFKIYFTDEQKKKKTFE